MHRQSDRTFLSATRVIRRAVVVLAVALALAAPADAQVQAKAQKTFASAKEAADALVAALGSEEDGALVEIFGPEVAKFEPTDRATARIERAGLAKAAKESLTLRQDDADQVTLVIGDQAWPFPIPVVASNGAWRFDTEAGLDELVNRVVGAHELAALDLCRAFVDAEAEYASADRDGDRVLEYAQRFSSSPGTQDGLYWPASAGDDESPLGPFVAAAGEHGQGRAAGDPYRGYYFKVLKKQGAGVPGGAYDYVINGNMIGGFALVAWPADYGTSGVMTFVVNQLGEVFEKDLGKGTAQQAAAMTTYAPDASWTASAE
jgi:hypothetical protein